MIDLKAIRQAGNWSLFLDRDGVINERLPGVYISDIRDLHFTEGCLEALALFTQHFRRIVVVTNQQGIGKGLMNEMQLSMVHGFMSDRIRQAGGRLDAIYYCTALESADHPDRKPNIGMGLKARLEFPDIDPAQSIMVGDSVSDILFGQRMGMKTVFIGPQWTPTAQAGVPDLCCESLRDFARLLQL